MHHLIARSEPERTNAPESPDLAMAPARPRFDRLTRLAALSCEVPVAQVALLDGGRQRCASHYGPALPDTPDSIDFCRHTVAQDRMLVVEDALRDPRFAAGFLVSGAPQIRFFAGQPLRRNGEPAGVLYIADHAPRTFTQEQRQTLRDLADLAEAELTQVKAVDAELEANERRLRAITENLPAMIGKTDAAGRFVFLNCHAVQVYGKSAAELLGQHVSSAYRPEDYARLAPWIARVEAGERVFFEYVAAARERTLHYQCCFVPQRTRDDRPDGFFALAVDITERKESELRLADSEERLRTITDNVPVLIAHLDSERRYVFANAVHQSWLGKPAGQILGKTMEEAFGADYLAPQAAALEQAWRGQASQCEHEIVRKKHTRIAHSTFLPQLRDGRVAGVYVLTLDATASRMHERSLHALAHTDTLTGLPNRRHFETALQGANRAPRAGRGAALLYLDVDHFKQINDRHGHAVGDAVLVEFARRLSASVRNSDLVARLAGDEFTVLLQDVAGEAGVELVANKILAAMRAPFVLGALTLQVGASIGAALAEPPNLAPARLLDAADHALYTAKQAGRNTWALRRLGRSQVHAPEPAHV
jgi:diguanylate cyclase (GGDEF)-like protein/PAS domain S-box-containing protein